MNVIHRKAKANIFERYVEEVGDIMKAMFIRD